MEKLCDFFTLRPYDLITTLTYVLMDNFLSLFIMHYTYFTYCTLQKVRTFKKVKICNLTVETNPGNKQVFSSFMCALHYRPE